MHHAVAGCAGCRCRRAQPGVPSQQARGAYFCPLTRVPRGLLERCPALQGFAEDLANRGVAVSQVFPWNTAADEEAMMQAVKVGAARRSP